MSFGFLNRIRTTWGLHTLGLRLVIGYAVLFIVSMVLLSALAYVLFNHYMQEPDRTFMRTQAHELASAYEEGGVEALRMDLGTTTADERREELLVHLADGAGGTVLLYNPDSWTATEIARLKAGIRPEAEAWIRLGPAEDDDALEAFALRLSDDHILQVGMDADLRHDAMASMRDVFLAIALPVVVLALLGGALMAYRALRPIRDLTRTLHAVIDTGDIKKRVPETDVRGEFGDVVRLFNRMLHRIEALVIGMHGTLDNVAHDLRTPLTRLRGRAELALHQERDAAGYREALADSLEESETVTRMLDTIMDVAEAESGTMPLHLESIHLNEAVLDVIDLYRLVAEDKEISLHVAIPDNLAVVADRNRIRQVVANLVDNAIKYTPSGGHISLEAAYEEQHVALRVRDTGFGIPPEEQPRIWDRMYRGDRSRSERGLGLGLSLVNAIIAAHGGAVGVESSDGSGSVFTVTLPRGDRHVLRPNLSNL